MLERFASAVFKRAIKQFGRASSTSTLAMLETGKVDFMEDTLISDRDSMMKALK